MKKKLSSTAAFDGVPPTIYNRAAKILALFVYLLFLHVKESFTRQNLRKGAHISPIHKKGSRKDAKNYRPITILPRILLIFERYHFNCMNSTFEHALKPLQHGLRSKHSTITQIIVFLHNLHLSFDKI